MVPVDAKNAAEVAKAVKAGELPGPAKSLADAMVRVWGRVSYVRKDKRMQGGGSYTYVSDAALIDAIRPELVAEGVTFAPVGMEPVVTEVFENKNGSRQNRVLLRATYRFTHAGSGQTLDVVTCGEGMDVGDKATNKAMTAAAKYALRQAFCIETGDDPDDTPSHEQQRAAAIQAGASADNPGRRAAWVQKLAQVTTPESLTAVGKQIKADIDGGMLGPGDKAALTAAYDQTQARVGKPAAK